MSPAASDPRVTELFHERLTPAWWLWSAPVGLGLGLGLILVPLGLGLAATVFVLSSLLFVALLARSTPTVGVVAGSDASGGGRTAVPDVVAGTAHVPVTLVGTVDVLDAEGMRHAHGPGLDARAYLCLRGWVHSGVRIHLVDPEDPTPYWLVSSRRPQAFADAVAAAGAAARSGRSAPDGPGQVSTTEPRP
jgi:hypothetical protein